MSHSLAPVWFRTRNASRLVLLLSGVLLAVLAAGISVRPAQAQEEFNLTAHEPVTNAVGVDLTTSISATFDANVDADTVTSRTFAVHAGFGGLMTGTYTVTNDLVEEFG